ncbi:AsmA family protein [Agarivorans sp. 3_MG-2023]|nr:AsmA family protein [Agarivorans sp. 3_MG-2023]
MTRWLKRSLISFAVLLGILLLPIVLLVVGIKVEIGDSRQFVTNLLSEQLQRDVQISGEINLELSFRPAINVEQIEIANPSGFSEPYFAQVRQASVQIEVLPLLRRHLQIDQILLDGFYLELIRAESGENNWQFAASNTSSQATSAKKTSSEQTQEGRFSWQGINYSFDIKEQILISDVSINYRDQAAEAVLNWHLEELKLTSIDSETLAMTAYGSMLDESYSVDSTWQLEPLLQGRAGDIALNMQVADAKLGLSGKLAPQSDQNSYMELNVDWQNAQSIGRLLGDDLAHLAPIKLATRFDGKPGQYSLSPISAQLASSIFKGELALSGQEPLEINGKLNIDKIDLAPWLAELPDETASKPLADNELPQVNSAEPQAQLAGAQNAEPEEETLPLLQIIRYWFNQANADLSLTIGSIEGLPQEIANVSVGLKVEGESLKAPLRAVVDDIRFRGNLKASIIDDSLNTSMRLVAQKSPLDKLASRIPMLAGSTGSIGRSVLRISAKGTTVAELFANSHFNYNIEDSQMLLPAGTAFNIKQASLTASVDSEVSINIDGILLDIPVKAELKTSPLRAMLNEQAWNVNMQLDSPAIEMHLAGELPNGKWQDGASLSVNANGPRIGLLAPWLGVDKDAQGAIKLALDMQLARGESSLRIRQLQLADSQGAIQASWNKAKTEQGLISITSDWRKIDVEQLSALMPSAEASELTVEQTPINQADSTSDAKAAGIDLRLPILPQGFAIHDADLAISINKLLLGDHQLENVSFSGLARDGWLQKAPFSAEFAQSKFSGNAVLDLRSSPLTLDFAVASKQPNIGQLLKQFNIAEQAEIRLDKAEFNLALSGDNIAQLLASTELSAKLSGGYWTLVDPNTQASARVELSEGSVSASPNKPLQLALNGQLKQLPLALSIRTLSLAEFTQKPDALPIELDLDLAEVALHAEAKLPRPISLQNLSLAVDISSPKLSLLDSLHGIQLPPFGPIKLAGELVVSSQGYAINNMLLSVAESELSGAASLVTTGAKPMLDIAISANNIQLDDFKTGGWQGWANDTSSESPARPESALKTSDQQAATNPETEESAQAMLSQQVFEQLNAKFRLDVEKVQSGDDWLGQGKLYWTLQDARFQLAPLWLALPGGEIHLSGELSTQGAGFYSELTAKVENFDYGLLARRIKPDTEMNGEVSVHLDVNSRFETPQQWLENMNGQVGFGVWPQQFEAGIMDLWAVSLASAVVPELDDSEKSVLNCVVAVFDSKDGQLAQNVLLADTSRMRVLGETQVDFDQQQVNMILRPQAKRAQIFGLSTPVQVSGSFEDFKIGVASGGLIGTTLRFVTSPVVSPLRWIVEAPLDADGSELCRQAWQQAKQENAAE